MSTEIHEGSLRVTRLVGPADDGQDRARWQIEIPSGADYVTLRRDEVVVLAAALANSAADLPPDTAERLRAAANYLDRYA